jgi:SAM-dependent methyltransferase
MVDWARLRARRAHVEPLVDVFTEDVLDLPFPDNHFDVVVCESVLDFVDDKQAAIRECVRVTKPGGRILVADQIAPADPLAALELTRFEHARDPSTTRVLSDADLRGLFDANGLVLRREVVDRERRDLDAYLDLAGCEGEQREHAKSLAPSGYEAVVAWYVLSR